MPIIPDVQALGERDPRAVRGSPNYVGLVGTDPAIAAQERLGKAIQDAGETGTKIGLEYVKDQQNTTNQLNTARADASWATSKIRLNKELSDASDPDGVEKDHPARYEASLQEAAQLVPESQRELWVTKRKAEIAERGVAVQNKAFELRKDKALGETIGQLEALRQQGATATSPEDRQSAIEAGQKLFESLNAAGYLTDQQTAAQRQKWARDFTFDTFQAMPADRRLAALGEHAGTNFEGPAVDRAAAILREKEQFRSSTYADMTIRNGERVNSGYRLGFGSDTITDANGTIRRVQQGDTVTREDAERDLKRRVGESLADVQRAVGPEAFAKLSANQQAALASVAYNYGSLSRDELRGVVGAVQSGDAGEISSSIERLQGHNGGINRSRRLHEAAIARTPDGGSVTGKTAGFLTPEQRTALATGAERELDQASRAETATVRQLLKDDEASIMATGRPVDVLTPERVARTMGPEAAETFVQSRAQATRFHNATNDWETIPTEQIGARLAGLKPEPGTAGFASAQGYYDAAAKRAGAIAKQRAEDPAGAVDQLPDVRAARQAAGDRPEAFQGVVKARLVAQDRLGIPPMLHSPISAAEARAYAAPLQQVMPGQERVAAQQIVSQVRERYGEHADRALQSILAESGVHKDVAEQAAVVFKRLGMGDRVTPEQARAVDEAQKTAAAGRAVQGLADPVATGGSFQSGPVVSAPPAERAPPVGAFERLDPDTQRQAIEALRTSPETAPQFDAVFGAGAAAKVLKAAPAKARREAKAQ